jgi:glycosyltransferase involved in cell wall biosynthesis
MIEPRIIGHMVTRNEMNRYLPTAIEWLRELTRDDVFVYDDGSTDDTYGYLQRLGVPAIQREPGDPTFLENEGVFRMMAWREMEIAADPTERDWILCVDADELLLGTASYSCDTRKVLLEEVRLAVAADIDAVTFDVAEAFALDGGHPKIRTDGYWGKIRACRLVRWRRDGRFAPRAACGSVPTPWINQDWVSLDLTLLHLGYAREADRLAKHERYSAGSGHNPQHVRSIMSSPMLSPWMGQRMPDIST